MARFDAAATRRLAESLVRIESVSPSAGESRVAEALLLFSARAGLEIVPESRSRLPDGRRNGYAIARGRGRDAIVFLGHTDTVGVADFASDGRPPRDAFRPERLRAPRGFLRGRGALDMKSGLAAAAVAAASRAARRDARGSVIFCAVADEENESAGVRSAIEFLARARERFDLRGAVNVDYVTRTASGRVPVYAGTVGKALVGVFAHGLPAHAGDPLRGVDASLLLAEAIREIDLDPALAGGASAPPVALRFGDMMGAYNVQTPDAAVAFFNLLLEGDGLGARLRAFERALRRAARSARERLASRGRRVGRVAVRRFSSLDAPLARRAGPRAPDARAAAAAAVRDALRADRALASEPALVLFLAPPFYPPDDGRRAGALVAAVERALAAEGPAAARQVEIARFYPYISDMSFLGLSSLGERALACAEPEMPVPHGLPLAAMRALGLPSIDMGPVGEGAHSFDERVETRFSFGVLPRLLARVADEVLDPEAKRKKGPRAGERGGRRAANPVTGSR